MGIDFISNVTFEDEFLATRKDICERQEKILQAQNGRIRRKRYWYWSSTEFHSDLNFIITHLLLLLALFSFLMMTGFVARPLSFFFFSFFSRNKKYSSFLRIENATGGGIGFECQFLKLLGSIDILMQILAGLSVIFPFTLFNWRWEFTYGTAVPYHCFVFCTTVNFYKTLFTYFYFNFTSQILS